MSENSNPLRGRSVICFTESSLFFRQRTDLDPSAPDEKTAGTEEGYRFAQQRPFTFFHQSGRERFNGILRRNFQRALENNCSDPAVAVGEVGGGTGHTKP